jgi:site-specific DNA recombinase
MLTTARNRWGTEYPYFICSGRTRKTTGCQRQATHVETVEELIEDEYRTVALSPELRDSVEELVLEDFDTIQDAAAGERQLLEKQRADLTRKRQKLLEAHYAGAIPMDLLKTEQDQIAASSDGSIRSSPPAKRTSRRPELCSPTRSTSLATATPPTWKPMVR